MRKLAIVATIPLLIAFAQSQHKFLKEDLKAQIEAITHHLRKAQWEKSPSVRKKEILRAQKLVSELPISPLTDEIESRLNRAVSVGISTEDAEMFLDEAVELAEIASKLLRQTPDVDLKKAEAALARVLNSPEFREPLILRLLRWLSSRIGQPLERFLNWLAGVFAWLGRFLRTLFEFISSLLQALGMWFWYWFQLLLKISPVLAWSMVGVVGAIILTSLTYGILRWWKWRKRIVSESVIAQALVLPEQLLREAEVAAQKGDYLSALRKAYKALLLTLDRIGLIRFREQRTNWEYLAEIQNTVAPDFARKFREITHTFDFCFYARKSATANEYAVVKQFAEELVYRPYLQR